MVPSASALEICFSCTGGWESQRKTRSWAGEVPPQGGATEMRRRGPSRDEIVELGGQFGGKRWGAG